MTTTSRTYLLEERERRQGGLDNNHHKKNMKISIPKREEDISALDTRLLEVFDDDAENTTWESSTIEEQIEEVGEKTVGDDGVVALSPEVLKLLNGPMKGKTEYVYKRYQAMLVAYIMEKGGRTGDENTIINFIVSLKDKYAPSTLWGVYASINNLNKRKKSNH